MWTAYEQGDFGAIGSLVLDYVLWACAICSIIAEKLKRMIVGNFLASQMPIHIIINLPIVDNHVANIISMQFNSNPWKIVLWH